MNCLLRLRVVLLSFSLIPGSLKPARCIKGARPMHRFSWSVSDSSVLVPAASRGVSCVCAPSLWGAPTPSPSPLLGRHRAPSWASGAARQLPTSCYFYPQWFPYVTATLSAHPTLSSPSWAHVSSLRLHLYSCPENGFTDTSFLDSKCMHK